MNGGNDIYICEMPFAYPDMTYNDYEEIKQWLKENGVCDYLKKVFDHKVSIKPYKERTKEYAWKMIKGIL